MRGRPLPRRMEHAATVVVALCLAGLAVPGIAGGAAIAAPTHHGGPPSAGRVAGSSPPDVRAPQVGSGATGRLVVETSDPAAMPNSGLRTNITAFSSPTLPADTSLQVSVTETIGAYDAVFGIFLNDLLPP